MHKYFGALTLTLSLLVPHFMTGSVAYGQDQVGDKELKTIYIEADRFGHLDDYETFKSEKISNKQLHSPKNQTLADVVKNQPGLETQNYCNNCGAKRLTINGLKGEHTSILVDGLPLHSAISSFYGMDAVPLVGLEEVIVMRGAGASLTNPEAIGGTLQLITLDPLKKARQLNVGFSLRENYSGHNIKGRESYSLLSTHQWDLGANNQKLGIALGGQFSALNFWDEDQNSVAEAPEREGRSGFIKLRYVPNSKNDLSLRLAVSDLNILGGTANSFKPEQLAGTIATLADFVGGDVRNRFIGAEHFITDRIRLKRREAAFTWTNYINSRWTMDVKAGYAQQEQQSIYMHNFDYANLDRMFVADFSTQYSPNEKHIFRFGAFIKSQDMESQSFRLFSPTSVPLGLGLTNDTLQNQSFALYAQDTYLPTDHLTLDFALRVDQMQTNWINFPQDINQTVIAPRFQLKHDITHHLSQRFSYGLGYRSPLTFFESQHGNSEVGFTLGVDKIERAHSAVYSLSLNEESYYITGSHHFTRLENMAYGLDIPTQPINYLNYHKPIHINVSDILAGVKLKHWWLVEAGIEIFNYETQYKNRLPTAAIEQRVQLKSEMKFQRWQWDLNGVWVGARDLSKYGGYEDHYNTLFVNGSSQVEPTNRKNQRSPAFWTFNTSFQYQLTKTQNLTFSVLNLLDETQLKHNDGPSMWHWHFTHAHFDNLHTWGPNRGREFLLNYQYKL